MPAISSTIDAPVRAEDAAIVPVAIRVAETLGPEIRDLYLVIDNNPSPLAAHFVLGPLADPREITTRVRIDDYTYLHAVAETADGRLYSAARFIKAAGGLLRARRQGPGARPRTARQNEIGLGRPARRPRHPIKVKLLISHPNNSGLQMDQATRNYIPADFMQTLDVTYNGQPVFRLESDIAISEDPSFSFSFRQADPAAPGVIKAEDARQQSAAFQSGWPVPAAPHM